MKLPSMFAAIAAPAIGMLLTLSTPVMSAPNGSAKTAIDPADYPSLDDKELGHIRRFVHLSRLMNGDWSGMSDDLYAVAERTQQFQLAYMAAALALIQHQYTPAYRELYRPTMDALIQKMTLPDIWESWLKSSRGGTAESDPDSSDLAEGWLDPVARYNNMLKAYLLQAGALYEMLYRDGRYDRPDAFTFKFDALTWGNGAVTYRYSLGDVAKIIYQEYVDNNYEGVLCEPNRIFPSCNQPPILGLLSYDQTHGTHYAADVMPKFAAAWVRRGYTNPVTKQNVHFIFARTGEFKKGGTPVLDGWAGAWMHAWNPDLMQTIYPPQRDLYVPVFLSGAYARKVPSYNKDMLSIGYGQIAFMAAEMGDLETRRKMLDYAERNFNPTWEQGAYYYPRSADYVSDAQGNSHGVSAWTGNVLLALARLDKGGGFQRLYREPWTKAQLDAPQITNVDDLLVNVSQAFYDSNKRALIVTLKPGPVPAQKVNFTIAGLTPNGTYRVVKDGQVLGKISRKSSTAGADVHWQPDDTVTVTTTFAEPHSFVVVAE
jgi:hypothetical protein